MGSPTEDHSRSFPWAVCVSPVGQSFSDAQDKSHVPLLRSSVGPSRRTVLLNQSPKILRKSPSSPSTPPKISHFASCLKLCPFPGPIWFGPFSAASLVGRCPSRGFQADEGLRRLFRPRAVDRGSCQGPAWCVETVPKCYIPGGCGALVDLDVAEWQPT